VLKLSPEAELSQTSAGADSADGFYDGREPKREKQPYYFDEERATVRSLIVGELAKR